MTLQRALPEVQWRRLSSHLWAGGRDGYPIGQVEQGRRYAAIDPLGTVRGRFRTLEEAEGALVEPRPVLEAGRRTPWWQPVLIAVVGAVGAVGTGIAALGWSLIG